MTRSACLVTAMARARRSRWRRRQTRWATSSASGPPRRARAAVHALTAASILLLAGHANIVRALRYTARPVRLAKAIELVTTQ